jgi:hypothetical protein
LKGYETFQKFRDFEAEINACKELNCSLSLSLGTGLFEPAGETNIEALIAAADQVFYKNKKASGGKKKARTSIMKFGLTQKEEDLVKQEPLRFPQQAESRH